MPLDDRDWYRDALREKQGHKARSPIGDNTNLYQRELEKSLRTSGRDSARGNGTGYWLIASLAATVALLVCAVVFR